MEVADVDGRIVLKLFFKICVRGHGLDLSGLEQEQVAGCCECGDEIPGFIKCGKFLGQPRTSWFLQKDPPSVYK